MILLWLLERELKSWTFDQVEKILVHVLKLAQVYRQERE